MIPRALALLVVMCLAFASSSARAQNRRQLSLADAIAIALQHNGDLYLAKTDTAIAAEDISFADAVFIPRLLAEVRVWSERNPASASAVEFKENAMTGSIGVAGRRPSGL